VDVEYEVGDASVGVNHLKSYQTGAKAEDRRSLFLTFLSAKKWMSVSSSQGVVARQITVGGAIRNKCGSGSPVVPGQKDHLRCRPELNPNVSVMTTGRVDEYPALRMAVTAAWTEVAQALISGISWGSFILEIQ
jgi:hypothetical protein